ncbi:Cyclin-T1 [Orchesella cincta]|uniref:Cyclin-T1 n=1 Tax=Orchesella cincta TaxID=48709 RepID=A0A1D2MF48_ORCCI|nr:Cyclin-T1 [Orchesella cincta]
MEMCEIEGVVMSSQTTSTSLPPSVLTDDGLSGVTDSTGLNRSDPDRWYFLKERLDTTPSRKSGIDADKELTYRQQSANFIQDIGQRLQVNQLCINTAIVYMHRFYMFHSFTQFHRNAVSAASIFLAAKVEEQPRKLEHVIKVAHYCLHRDHQPQIDTKSEQYLEQSAELVMNENILLQTLGFDVAIDHPHTHVVKCCQLVRASKDLAQTSYFMATNSLHLTTMCLQYKPTVVACVCIHLACKWSSWEIPRSKEGKDWFWYVDDTVTSELLEKLTTDFLQIFNKSPSRLKKKIISLNAASTSSLSLTNVPYHGFDSSPGQPHNRSRSPSPKRPVNTKPSSSQPGHPGKVKLPPGASFPHHLLPKPSAHHPPGVAGSGNKHPHPHPSSHSSSGKPPHPGMPPGSIKDPHHPQHPKQPYPHGHGQNVAHGQYPHGSRPGMPSSGSSQSHHGHGGHSKPPGSGSASSHPYSSSSSMKNMQAHNPSKPPHMPPSGAPKMPPNQVPGAVKNPNQPMFHSSQSHVKKPYGSEGRPEFGMKREGPASGSMHHSQNHARPHDKVVDGRHHSSASGMPQSHSSTSQSSSDSRSSTHHNMPYLAQDMDRSGGSSNQKLPYMDSRSMDPSDMNRHRNMPPSDPKRAMSHGAPTATNGNNNDSVGSKSTGGAGVPGVGESHVPSKNAFRPPGSTLGQHSQSEMGAKYHSDSFGGEYGSSYGSNSSNSNILTIEDRASGGTQTPYQPQTVVHPSTNANKRPRPDNYASSASTLPLSTSSLFSPEEPSDSNKRLPQVPSQFSPPPMETAPSGYSKVPDLSQHSGNSYSGGSDGITFGSTETKADLRRVNPSSEFQAPELLPPINDTPVKMDHKEVNSAPRAASLFSPEFTPSNSVPPTLKISPHPDIHKRDVFASTKAEAPDNILLSQQTTSGYSEGSSQHSFTGRLSSSPKREDGKDDDSHSSKNKKKKKEKHKHKHKEEKKHKKDKHKEKDKEKEKDKDKKERHRTKEKHSAPPVEVSNDVSSHKIKIKIGRDESKRSAVQPLSSHSSSKTTNSSSLSIPTSNPVPMTTPLPGLKVKISSKGRVSSVDDDAKYEKSKQDLSGGGSTPCCPGIGPCVKCNREQDQYGYFNAPLTLKIAKSKDPSKSSKDSSSRDSKKSKDKSSKTSGSSSASLYPPHLPPNLSSSRPPSASNHYVHKNGVEKSSKKKEKSAPVL